MESWQSTYNQLIKEPPNSIVVMAGPHNGDAIWVTPHLKTLKDHHPETQLIVCCPTNVTDIFSHNPHIDKLIPVVNHKRGDLPKISMAISERSHFTMVVPPICVWPVFHEYNLLRIPDYLSRRGYTIGDIKPQLYISTSEMDDIIAFMAKYRGGPRFMVETFSYSRQTSFNAAKLQQVVDYVMATHREAWFFIPCSIKELSHVPTHPRIVPINQFTVRQSGFLVNFCNYMLSCSSGVSHACSSTLANSHFGWLETVSHKWHSTKPYKISKRKYHIGTEMEGYFHLLQELLTSG